MSQSTTELAEALADVRRAYRLLWAFQKRILDYNRIIRERLEFSHWSSDSPFKMSTWNPETRSVWGMLPMVNISFRASRRRDDTQYKNGKWSEYPRMNDAVLCVWSRSDTGMPAFASTDPNPLTFRNVEECQTKLCLYLVLNRPNREIAVSLWGASEHCFNIVAGAGTMVSHPKIDGIDIFGMDFDLAELPDEHALLKGIEAFSTAAGNALGVPLDQLPRL
ncbi:hypothetical protein [Rhodopila sp.]|uniref:hypothetical protein n=1 Tax=Rhodopila sp. TaxID=2480087 RepID=UPI003D0B35DB